MSLNEFLREKERTHTHCVVICHEKGQPRYSAILQLSEEQKQIMRQAWTSQYYNKQSQQARLNADHERALKQANRFRVVNNHP